LAVASGDPRNIVGGGSEAAESDGAADGAETISAWTTTGAINPKTRARAPIREGDLCISVLSSSWCLVLEASMHGI
jgi:hypothetical protein